MDVLANINISGLQYEDVNSTLEIFNGGNTWYSIRSWVEDPKYAGQYQQRLDSLVSYMPRNINEEDLQNILRRSPINEENMMKLFHQVETSRNSVKTQTGNAKCKKCKGEAFKSVDQTRSGDEASTITTTCLDPSCKFVKKE